MSSHTAAMALAERIFLFWKSRGVTISITLVEHYGEYLIRSSLTGREPCEPIKVRQPQEAK